MASSHKKRIIDAGFMRIFLLVRNAIPMIIGVSLLTGCGGGGGGGEQAANPAPPVVNVPTPPPVPPPDPPPDPDPERCAAESTDVTAPIVNILFPFDGAMTTASTIMVNGTAVDDHCIEAVRVNGVEALTDDDFNTWSIAIPLTAGDNPISVTATDGSGNQSATGGGAKANVSTTRSVGGSRPNADSVATAIVIRHATITNIVAGGAVLDPIGDRILLVDSTTREIYSQDLDTGEFALVSGDSRGTGPELNSPFELAIAPP